MKIFEIPKHLNSGPVHLVFEKIVTPNPVGELVPFYHFKIVNEEDIIVGHINLKIGDTRHITMCAGNIGYEILEKYRGNSFSYHACLALVPFIKNYYDKIIITVDPTNFASIRIIEKLGATFIDKIKIPPDDPSYLSGAHYKKRFKWMLT